MRLSRAALRMRRDHRWSPDRMSDYLGDDLSPNERRRLERHLRECADCARVMRTLEALLVELRGVREGAGDAVAESVLRAVRTRLDEPLDPA